MQNVPRDDPERENLRVSIRTLLVTGVCGLILTLSIASARTGPNGETVRSPRVLAPGHSMTVRIEHYGPGSRVRVSMGRYFRPARNCCASNTYPPIDKPGLRVPSTGRLTFRMRVPRLYAECVSIGCERSGDQMWHRYKRGQWVYVGVLEDDNDAYASALARIG